MEWGFYTTLCWSWVILRKKEVCNREPVEVTTIVCSVQVLLCLDEVLTLSHKLYHFSSRRFFSPHLHFRLGIWGLLPDRLVMNMTWMKNKPKQHWQQNSSTPDLSVALMFFIPQDTWHLIHTWSLPTLDENWFWACWNYDGINSPDMWIKIIIERRQVCGQLRDGWQRVLPWWSCAYFHKMLYVDQAFSSVSQVKRHDWWLDTWVGHDLHTQLLVFAQFSPGNYNNA